MSSWTLLGDGYRYAPYGQNGSTAAGTTLTSSASTHTMGSLVTIGTLDFQCHALLLQAFPTTGADFLMTIGAEVGGVFTPLIEHILLSGQTGRYQATTILPLALPAGTVLRGQVRSTAGSSSVQVMVHPISGGLYWLDAMSICDTYGAVATGSATGGTQCDPGGTLGTKNGWTAQLSTGITRPAKAMILSVGSRANTAHTDAGWLVDIGIGPSGQQVVLLPNLVFVADATGDMMGPVFAGPFPVNIPSGTALWAQSACSNNNATDRLFDIVAYCFS